MVIISENIRKYLKFNKCTSAPLNNS